MQAVKSIKEAQNWKVNEFALGDIAEREIEKRERVRWFKGLLEAEKLE